MQVFRIVKVAGQKNFFKNLLAVQQRSFGNWIPDGKERNDYKHKDFVPYDYEGHDLSWDR